MQIKSKISAILAIPLLLIVRVYQLFISPMLGQNCRFYPTCSCYAHQALSQHGAYKGSILAVTRIVKCHPLHPGGIDHVPMAKNIRARNKDNDIATTKNVKTNKNVINSATQDTIKKPTF